MPTIQGNRGLYQLELAAHRQPELAVPLQPELAAHRQPELAVPLQPELTFSPPPELLNWRTAMNPGNHTTMLMKIATTVALAALTLVGRLALPLVGRLALTLAAGAGLLAGREWGRGFASLGLAAALGLGGAVGFAGRAAGAGPNRVQCWQHHQHLYRRGGRRGHSLHDVCQ